jgi:hypothetical protein
MSTDPWTTCAPTERGSRPRSPEARLENRVPLILEAREERMTLLRQRLEEEAAARLATRVVPLSPPPLLPPDDQGAVRSRPPHTLSLPNSTLDSVSNTKAMQPIHYYPLELTDATGKHSRVHIIVERKMI